MKENCTMADAIDVVNLELPKAVQIINSNNHTFELQLNTIKQILEADEIKDRNIVVVSMAGSLRKGKSFLLNFFLKYLHAKYKRHNVSDWIGENGNDDELKGFSWRGGKNPETIGIWMWSEVFTYDIPKGDRVAIILLDTQGIFDNESSMKDCISIFAVSMLLSSVQCFNIMRAVQEDDLQHLDLFMEYARLAMEESSERPFQDLIFVVRDWPFPYENDYGYSQEYIDNILAGNDRQTPDMRQLRERIQTTFVNIKSFLMAYPGKDVAQKQEFKGNIQQIDAEFVECVKVLVPSIFAPENLVVKKINGEKVRARDLMTFLQSYLNAFKGDEIPEPKSVLMATAEAHIQILNNNCLKMYMDTMHDEIDNVETFFTDDELMKIHMDTQEKSSALFKRKPKLGGVEFIEERFGKLVKEINAKFENFKHDNEMKKDRVSTIQNRVLAISTLGVTVAGAVGSFLVAGPSGLALFSRFSEAGAALLSGLFAGGAAGGAVGGAGIGTLINKITPRTWFHQRLTSNRAIEGNNAATPVTENASGGLNESRGFVADIVSIVSSKFRSWFGRNS